MSSPAHITTSFPAYFILVATSGTSCLDSLPASYFRCQTNNRRRSSPSRRPDPRCGRSVLRSIERPCLLQSVLDGVWFTPRDVGGAQGMHDLDLADGCTFAVEVTSDKSQADTAFHLSGAVGPGALVDAVREHLPRKRANTNQHAHSTWTHNRVPLRPTLPDLGNETRTVSCHTCVTYAWPVSVIAECVRNTGLANESDCDEAYAGSGKLGGPAVRTQAVGAAGRAGAVGLTVATSACGHARGGPARRCHRHRRRFR